MYSNGDQHYPILSGDAVVAAFDRKYVLAIQSAAMASTEPVAKRTK
jgi:hypothetical protein